MKRITPERLLATYRVLADKSSPPGIEVTALLLAADTIMQLDKENEELQWRLGCEATLAREKIEALRLVVKTQRETIKEYEDGIDNLLRIEDQLKELKA